MVVLALVGLIAWYLWLAFRRRGASEIGTAPPPAAFADEKALLGRELSLASEHLHSIRLLLEISQSHQQPIPTAALRNLELVSKHLLEIRRRVDPGPADLSAPAHLRSAQAPPHPQQLSFECHVSPSDRSTPSG